MLLKWFRRFQDLRLLPPLPNDAAPDDTIQNFNGSRRAGERNRR